MFSSSPKLPLWLKLLFTLWIIGWAPIYFQAYGPQNYLWICNLANFIILIGIWFNSRLLLSSQAVATLLVGVFWSFDLGTALVAGFHPLNATAYMLDQDIDLHVRLLSLFHLHLPVIALYCVWRLGYDSRGVWLQFLVTGVVLPLSYFFGTVDENINWVYAPFGYIQSYLPPELYLPALWLSYLVILYLPAHWLVRALTSRGRSHRWSFDR